MTGGRALSADDRALLECLLREHGPRLMAYARRLCPRAADADDVFAEAFCRAAANVDGLRRTDRKDLYVLATIRNLCRDGFRVRRPLMRADTGLDELPSAAMSDVHADDPRREQILAAVEALPETLREVVAMRLSGEFTFEDIAKVLNVPLGTALSRMHIAVRRLRNILGVSEVTREAAI